MTTLAIELCDAGVNAATAAGGDSLPVPVNSQAWPGFAWQDGRRIVYGREAEDVWLVHPRQVSNNFLAKLAHESTTSFSLQGRTPSFSELTYYFLRDYMQSLEGIAPAWDKVVLAVPGSYLKDPATEEERVGLLLGIAGELKLPLAGIMDLACAALCDPRAPGFNPALPVLFVDIHLHGAELSLLVADDRLRRRHFLNLPSSGSLQLLKHLTSSMGNRFLRHTAFDILADGRIEQSFLRQTEEFVASGHAEHRYQINTATRAYDLIAKAEQLAGDAQPFVAALARSLQAFVHEAGFAPELLTAVLTHRAAAVPGLEARLRADGFRRLLRLQPGAAACGAAKAGADRLQAVADLGDVPVEHSVPIAAARRALGAPWQAQLLKSRSAGPRPSPTHAIVEGVGHAINGHGRFTIGSTLAGAQLKLPESFNASETCLVPLMHEAGRLWYVDPVGAEARGSGPDDPLRASVESGDRLVIKSGGASVEVLFAHCLQKAEG